MPNPKDYTVGWICALDTEYVAAQEFLDDEHEPPEFVSLNDTNHYTLGKLGQHNVVIAVLPDGEYGTASAASVAINMLHSFPNVRIGLMVGIGGGAPTERHDIRLGDIVVSAPRDGEGGVFQYDFGKTIQEQAFQYTRFLNQPPTVLRTAVMGIKTQHERKGHRLEQAIEMILEKNPRLRKYQRPQPSSDRLFHAKVTHDPRGCAVFCASDPSNLVKRHEREDYEDNPAVHYGLIASANQLMKNALIRDQLVAEKDVLCFEMEAAGLMNHFPCLVIRGICDYSDSHKSKEWQGYAAMAAAAYAKELLSHISPSKVEEEKRIIDILSLVQNTIKEVQTTVQETSTVLHSLHSDQKRERVIARLPYAKGSTADCTDGELDARCYPGTRIDLLRQIAEWADDRQGKCIFLLNGMAGTGKSTISRTVAEAFMKERTLGANFFFKRGEADRSSATKFFTTICAQLLVKVPALAVHVETALDADPYIPGKSITEQFEKLIYRPLSNTQDIPLQANKLVLVIDALDECERKEDIGIILRLLTRAKDIGSVKLRVFVTSRPELPVRLGFIDMSGDIYQDLVLHEIPRPIIESDISTFLEYKLAKIRNTHNKLFQGSRELPSDWPGPEVIRALVHMAVPLFIFAATVCRFVEDQAWSDPAVQLAKVLKYQTKAGESEIDKLDATYSPILDQLISERTERAKKSLVDKFRNIIGQIIHLAEPLSCSTLTSLLGIDSQSLRSQIASLHSVFSVPFSDHSPIRMLHLSFRNFLVDSNKRTTNPFWIDEREMNKIIAFKCLERMSVSGCLRGNICSLESLGKLRTNIGSGVIDSCLPPDVRYACCYWVYHLQQSEASIHDNDRVHIFLQRHFLHWLEVLSLLGRIAECVSLIHTLQVLVNDKDSEIYQLLRDAVRFIKKYSSMIDHAPLQLYSSALIFTPTTSIIRNTFIDKIPFWVQQLPEVESTWSAVLQTLEGHSDWVGSVAFSPDGRVLASGSGDKTIKLWDTATRTLNQTLSGHLWSVRSVAFSPDGRMLASGSNDKTIKLWDAATGALKYTLEGHSGSVLAVAFSPDGRMLASGSGDYNVNLWNIATGILQRSLCWHSSRITSLAFSNNSQLLASGSEDNYVMLWDAVTQAPKRSFGDYEGSVLSVAFSPDGQMLVSGSNDRKVKLWNTATGSLKMILDGHLGPVTSVVFTPDGRTIASGSNDRMVKLWNTATGTLKQSLHGHTGQVTTVAFSPESQVLASGSYDTTVRLWNGTTNSLQQPQTLEGHFRPVTSLSFSPNGKMLASGSDDKTIRLWNTTTNLGSLKLTLDGHSGSVTCLMFSPDSQLLASSSKDRTIKLWDTSTGLLKHTLSTYSEVRPRVFSPDGRMLISFTNYASDTNLEIWNTATGTREGKFIVNVGFQSVTFAPDGRLMALCPYGNALRLWDIDSGRLHDLLHNPNESEEEAPGGQFRSELPAAFSSDGKLLATGSKNSGIKLWNLDTGTVQQAVGSHSRGIQTLAFSPDGQYLETDKGRFHIENDGIPTIASDIQVENEWITRNGTNVIWLPVEYRATCSTTYENILAMGHASGRITFMKLI